MSNPKLSDPAELLRQKASQIANGVKARYEAEKPTEQPQTTIQVEPDDEPAYHRPSRGLSPGQTLDRTLRYFFIMASINYIFSTPALKWIPLYPIVPIAGSISLLIGHVYSAKRPDLKPIIAMMGVAYALNVALVILIQISNRPAPKIPL